MEFHLHAMFAENFHLCFILCFLGARAAPRKFFGIFCRHIYGYVLPSATERLGLQKGDLTRGERVTV